MVKKKRVSWIAGSLWGLTLQVLLIQIFISAIITIFLGIFASIGILQIAVSGWVVGETYGKQFKKNMDKKIKYQISKRYFYILATISLLFFTAMSFENLDLVVPTIAMYLFLGLPICFAFALLLYWSLGWYNVVKKKK